MNPELTTSTPAVHPKRENYLRALMALCSTLSINEFTVLDPVSFIAKHDVDPFFLVKLVDMGFLIHNDFGPLSKYKATTSLLNVLPEHAIAWVEGIKTEIQEPVEKKTGPAYSTTFDKLKKAVADNRETIGSLTEKPKKNIKSFNSQDECDAAVAKAKEALKAADENSDRKIEEIRRQTVTINQQGVTFGPNAPTADESAVTRFVKSGAIEKIADAFEKHDSVANPSCHADCLHCDTNGCSERVRVSVEPSRKSAIPPLVQKIKERPSPQVPLKDKLKEWAADEQLTPKPLATPYRFVIESEEINVRMEVMTTEDADIVDSILFKLNRHSLAVTK